MFRSTPIHGHDSWEENNFLIWIGSEIDIYYDSLEGRSAIFWQIFRELNEERSRWRKKHTICYLNCFLLVTLVLGKRVSYSDSPTTLSTQLLFPPLVSWWCWVLPVYPLPFLDGCSNMILCRSNDPAFKSWTVYWDVAGCLFSIENKLYCV